MNDFDVDAIFQLVFFVLIVAGWVIKAVVEAKRAKQSKGAPAPPRAEVDPVEPSEPGRVHVPRPVPRPAPRPPRRPLSKPLGEADRFGHLETGLPDQALGMTGGQGVPGRLLRSSAAAIAHGKQASLTRRASILGRLTGGQDLRPGRDLTRAGVLWSEILGPCRALTGPHRSPAATRRSGR